MRTSIFNSFAASIKSLAGLFIEMGDFPLEFLKGPGVGVLGVCFDAEGFEGEESFFRAGVISAGESSFFLFWLKC